MNIEKYKELKSTSDINVKSLDFYDHVQKIIEYDLAVLKKNVTIATNLRMSAAELEVETAALYHAQLWYDIEELKELTGN